MSGNRTMKIHRTREEIAQSAGDEGFDLGCQTQARVNFERAIIAHGGVWVLEAMTRAFGDMEREADLIAGKLPRQF